MSVLSSALLPYQVFVLFADNCINNFNRSYGYAENYLLCFRQK